MKIITADRDHESNLFSSNIPETDAPLGMLKTEYAEKAKADLLRMAVYEKSSEAGNLGNAALTRNSARWLRLGATNRFLRRSTSGSAIGCLADQVTIRSRHGRRFVSGVAVFGIAGGTPRDRGHGSDRRGGFLENLTACLTTPALSLVNTLFFSSPWGPARRK